MVRYSESFILSIILGFKYLNGLPMANRIFEGGTNALQYLEIFRIFRGGGSTTPNAHRRISQSPLESFLPEWRLES